MDFGSRFLVPAPPSVVFEKLLDPEVMRACIPGCEQLERLSTTQYRGQLRSEIADLRFDVVFSAEVLEMEAPTRLHAILQGEDNKTASSVRIEAHLELGEKGPVTTLSYALELALGGRLGRLGEANVRGRSDEVEQQFEEAFVSACRAAMPAGSSAGEAPTSVASLEPIATTSLRSWWRRLTHAPRPRH